MRVLDLFCGGGGASDGYARAGFEIVGVDHDAQPSYPYDMARADAINFLARGGVGPLSVRYNLIHASPPCQGYSKAVSSTDSIHVPTRGRNEPRLIEPIRDELLRLGIPYVIENVRDAAPFLDHPFMLCATMFGLPIPRHRYFETTFPVILPQSRGMIVIDGIDYTHPTCRGVALAYANANGIEYRDMSVTGKGRHAGTAARWHALLGMTRTTLMRQRDYSEAIPPAYTEWIGEQFANGA